MDKMPIVGYNQPHIPITRDIFLVSDISDSSQSYTTMFGISAFLTPKEVSKILRLNLLTVYGYIRSGDLHAVKFGRSYRIPQKELKRFIQVHLTK